MASRNARLQRPYKFCARFVREHYPTDPARIRGARPLDGPAYLRDGNGNMAADWWLHTDDSLSALGFVWLAHLFDREGLFNDAWMIGRSDQEAWALVSEPYVSRALPGALEGLRRELEQVGTDLLQYPAVQPTILVADVVSIHALVGAVARLIAADCPPLRADPGSS